jgi:hypothetical protein
MEEEQKGTEEAVEESTTEQEVPPAEKTNDSEDLASKKEIDVQEYDLLRKKAADFDGMVEKQRLAKLAKKDAPKNTKPQGEAIDMEAVIAAAKEEAARAADERIQEINRSTYETNLELAFRKFTNKHKWANSDEYIDKISQNFKRNSALTVDELVTQLDKAALENFPGEYTKSIEDSVKSRVLAEDSNIKAGGSGTSASVPAKDTVEVDTSRATHEDIRIAEKFFGGDVARYLKTKKRDI